MAEPVDADVVVRYLVQDPASAPADFQGVYPFFQKLEQGLVKALLPPLVVFQTYFVLTSYYDVPRREAASTLRRLLSLKGLSVPEKSVLRTCLETLEQRSVDLVDAYLAALCHHRQLAGVYSFDEGIRALGVEVLPVG